MEEGKINLDPVYACNLIVAKLDVFYSYNDPDEVMCKILLPKNKFDSTSLFNSYWSRYGQSFVHFYDGEDILVVEDSY